MSQFFGCVCLNPSIDISEVAQNMQQSMAFFKGDAVGIYQTNDVFICNKFLFNTPESLKTTSIVQNERYVLAASCRIDNRGELASKVNIKDAPTASDHAYILAAYTHYQEQCVTHLLGDFAFVVWDKQQETLFMARDHIGVRPHFYTYQNGMLLFSSDMNALRNLGFINTQYEKSYLAGMLHGEFIQRSVGVQYTCYEDIFRIKPSYYLMFDKNNLKEVKYWELKPVFPKEVILKEDCYQEFYQLFYQAVKCRMRGIECFGVGLELSGGLDSSSIACMSKEILRSNENFVDNLFSYSLVQSEEGRAHAPDVKEEEEHLQDLVLNLLRIKKENIRKLNKHPFENYFDEIKYGINVHGGLQMPNFTWQKSIYEAMRLNNCRVKLSGFAGDELVTDSGNLWMYDIWYKFRLSRILKELLRFDLKIYKSLLRYIRDRIFGYRMGKRSVAKDKDADFLSSDHLKDLPGIDYKIDVRSYKNYLVSRIMRPFISLRFEAENLHALRFNAECRYPMADIRLLEFMLKLPSDFFKPQNIKRQFIRKSLERILPEEIYNRHDKSGAVIPYLRFKNKVFLEKLLESGLPESFESSMVNSEKIIERLATPQNLKRETDVTSLLTAIYLSDLENKESGSKT